MCGRVTGRQVKAVAGQSSECRAEPLRVHLQGSGVGSESLPDWPGWQLIADATFLVQSPFLGAQNRVGLSSAPRASVLPLAGWLSESSSGLNTEVEDFGSTCSVLRQESDCVVASQGQPCCFCDHWLWSDSQFRLLHEPSPLQPQSVV